MDTLNPIISLLDVLPKKLYLKTIIKYKNTNHLHGILRLFVRFFSFGAKNNQPNSIFLAENDTHTHTHHISFRNNRFIIKKKTNTKSNAFFLCISLSIFERVNYLFSNQSHQHHIFSVCKFFFHHTHIRPDTRPQKK